MARPKLVSACAVGAVVLSVLGAASHVLPLVIPLPLRDTDVLALHFFDGRSRIFWFHSPGEPIRVAAAGSMIWIHSQTQESVELPEGEFGPPSPPSFGLPITIGSRRQIPALGGRWRTPLTRRVTTPFQPRAQSRTVESSYLRVPTWPLVILLMIPPVRHSLFERKRTRRLSRNECVACGYNLTGNESGTCPECGRTVARLTLPGTRCVPM